ncbi:MAG TPA: hypothetical protein VMW10_07175 [Alphaproteobacteria bacterium]|nr:hypothetical protein [Alphaproteobacteria bacterium]
MAKGNEILLKLKAENKQLKSKISDSKKKIDGMGKSVQKSSKLTSKAIGGMRVAYMGVAVAVGAVAMVFKKFFKLANKQIEAETRLNAALESTKYIAGLTAEEIKKMAKDLQEVTTIGDETTMMGQSLLLTFTKIGKDIFPEATETMLDMAVAISQKVNPSAEELKQSAIQLGKALNDPILGITALRRVGVQLSAQQETQIRKFIETNNIAGAQKVILGELKTQFGGMARAMAQTPEGAFRQLSNTLGDIGENVGKTIVPGLISMASALKLIMQDGSMLETVFSSIGSFFNNLIMIMVDGLLRMTIYFDTISKGFSVMKMKAKLFFNASYEGSKQYKKDAREIIDLDIKIMKGELERAKLKKTYWQTEKQRMAELAAAGKRAEEARLVALRRTTIEAEAERLKALEELKKESDLKKEEQERRHQERLKEIKDNAEKNKRQKQVEEFQNFVSNTQMLTGQLSEIYSLYYQNQFLSLDNEYIKRKNYIEKTVKDEGKRAEALEKLEIVYEKKRAKMAYEQAKTMKQIALVSAIQNTAQAVTKAYAQTGFFGGPAAGAIMAALGAIQIALIADQPLPEHSKGKVPVFQQGHVPPDHYPALIGSREAVINAESTRANEALLRSINENPGVPFGGSESTIIHTHINMDGKEVASLIDEHRNDIARRQGAQNYGRDSLYR